MGYEGSAVGFHSMDSQEQQTVQAPQADRKEKLREGTPSMDTQTVELVRYIILVTLVSRCCHVCSDPSSRYTT